MQKIDDIRNDEGTQVIPLIHNFLGNGDTYKKLLEQQTANDEINDHYNFTLKCTDGIFKGKFLYINTTPDGELFGSGDPDELDLTMYIESANLSDRHAEIKFVDNCKYILQDCGSETGTWIRIGQQGDNKEALECGLDLYQENRLRMFKAGDNQFVIEEHQNQMFDEVKFWLKSNYFQNLVQNFELKGLKTIQQVVQQVHRSDLENIGIEEKDIDRFMNLVDLMKRSTSSKVNIHNAPQKKLLVLRQIEGGSQTIVLDPDSMPIIFGHQEKNSQTGQKGKFVEISGKKIVDQHFEIDYDKLQGTIVIRNLNMNHETSCGLYKMLFETEHHNLQPGDAFRIGTLEFICQRFNLGIISDIGQRDYMEDYHMYVQQLFNIDNQVQITYYGVFDGHGGQTCADFCSQNLHIELRNQLEDVLSGIENSDDLNTTIQNCIKASFATIDAKYAKLYPKECKQTGSTAVIALIVGNKLYCANVGDARGILCRNGKAIDLSVDHKAKRADEQERIKSQGGYIVYGRVLGRLAISRSFGDFDCKNIEMPPENGNEDQPKVIRSFIWSEPEIRVIDLDPQNDDFFLLASDGLFDRFTSKECVKEISKKLKKMEVMEQCVQTVAQELVQMAKNKRMMSDNVTLLLISLNRGIETEENKQEKDME